MAETPQERILSMTALKSALSLADKKPIPCALALTKDRKDCLLLAEKTGNPKMLSAKLKKEGGDILEEKSVRFGFITIKPEDPETLHFTINKNEASGTVMALVRLAKKASYQAAVINADEALEKDGPVAEGEPTPVRTSAEPMPQTAPPEAPKPPPQEPQIDTAALKARLTELVKRMIGQIAQDASHKDELTALAKQAQTLLATGNPNLATEKADALEKLLDETRASPGSPVELNAEGLKARLTGLVKEMLARPDAPNKDDMAKLAREAQGLLAGGDLTGVAEKANALELLLRTGSGQARPDGDFVRMQKARLLWEAARKKAEAEIERFKDAVEADFAGTDDEDEILDALDQLDEIPENLDDRLTDALDDLLDPRTTPEERPALIQGAQALLGEYESFANGNALFKKLDGATPFGVSFSVASTMTQALKVLRASLR